MVVYAYINSKNINQNILIQTLHHITKLHNTCSIVFFMHTLPTHQNKNARFIVLKNKSNIYLAYWQKFVLPKLLLKNKATCFISDLILVNNKLPVPQIFFCDDATVPQPKKLAATVHIATNIFTTSSFISNKIIEQQPDSAAKIKNVLHAIGPILMPSYQLVQDCKKSCSNGNDYFLVHISTTSTQFLIPVLKAFSQLKKWQKCSMQMVILFDDEVENKTIPDFKNYKYKNEVAILTSSDIDETTVIAAAFAFIDLGKHSSNSIVFKVLQLQVLCILLNDVELNTIFNRAVLYVDADVISLSTTMQEVYKNEHIKPVLLQAAKQLLLDYEPQKVADVMYKHLQKTNLKIK